MYRPNLFAGAFIATTVAASFAVIAVAATSSSTTPRTDVLIRSCPSGQTFDEASGSCKSFFDIRGSFATPLPDERN